MDLLADYADSDSSGGGAQETELGTGVKHTHTNEQLGCSRQSEMSIDGLPLGDNKLHHDMQNDPDPKSGHVNGLRCVLDPVADGDPAGVMAQNTNLLIRMLKTSGTIGGHRVEHHDLDEDLLRQAVNDVSARWKRP